MAEIDSTWSIRRTDFGTFSNLCRAMEEEGHLQIAQDGESVVVSRSRLDTGQRLLTSQPQHGKDRRLKDIQNKEIRDREIKLARKWIDDAQADTDRETSHGKVLPEDPNSRDRDSSPREHDANNRPATVCENEDDRPSPKGEHQGTLDSHDDRGSLLVPENDSMTKEDGDEKSGIENGAHSVKDDLSREQDDESSRDDRDDSASIASSTDSSEQSDRRMETRNTVKEQTGSSDAST